MAPASTFTPWSQSSFPMLEVFPLAVEMVRWSEVDAFAVAVEMTSNNARVGWAATSSPSARPVTLSPSSESDSDASALKNELSPARKIECCPTWMPSFVRTDSIRSCRSIACDAVHDSRAWSFVTA